MCVWVWYEVGGGGRGWGGVVGGILGGRKVRCVAGRPILFTIRLSIGLPFYKTRLKQARTPLKQARTPLKQAQTPLKQAQTLLKQGQTPLKQARTPFKQAKKLWSSCPGLFKPLLVAPLQVH